MLKLNVLEDLEAASMPNSLVIWAGAHDSESFFAKLRAVRELNAVWRAKAKIVRKAITLKKIDNV